MTPDAAVTPIDATAAAPEGTALLKAVSELFAPVSGKITAKNEALDASPELVNESPYGKGWLVKIEPSDPGELDGLMDAAAYGELTADR